MMHPRDAAVVSFDCYGTLIDWQSGARAAVDAIPELSTVDRETLIARRLEVELEVEHEQYRPYDQVLAISIRRTAAEFGVELTAESAQVLRRLHRSVASVSGCRRVPAQAGNGWHAAGHPLQRHPSEPRRQRPQAGSTLRSAHHRRGCAQLQARPRSLASALRFPRHHPRSAVAHRRIHRTRHQTGFGTRRHHRLGATGTRTDPRRCPP